MNHSSDQLFVTCSPGVEKLLVEELRALSIPAAPGYRGVFVPKNMDNVYRINYMSKLATRVLFPLLHFSCRDKLDLYNTVRRFSWNFYLNTQKTFAVDATVSLHPNLKHSLFTALVVKDAICDFFRQFSGERPSVNVQNPDVQFFLHIHQEKAVLSFDTSNIPLYKRGYREEGGVAPLQESIAAAVVQFLQIKKEDVVCDPCCGSATLLLEAALFLAHIPPGTWRKTFGFFHHPAFQQSQWELCKEACDKEKNLSLPLSLYGSDKDPEVIETAKKNQKFVGVDFPLTTSPAQQLSLPVAPTLILTNPPYGKRLLSPAPTYRAIARLLQKYPGADYALICPEETFLPILGKKYRCPLSFQSGGLDLHLYTSKGA